MTYLKDTHRVELAILPALMLDIFRKGVNDLLLDETMATHDRLKRAAMAPMEGMSPKDAAKIIKRVDRVRKELMTPLADLMAPTAKAGLIVMHLMRLIVDSDYLVITPGGDLDRSLATFIAAIDHAYQDDATDLIAQATAHRMLRELQTQHGLFRAVMAAEAA